MNSEHQTGFGRNFWLLNTIEMFERLAFYNLRVVAPIYIMQAEDPGGLHLTAAQKGTIYAWWAAFQSILPVFTGGIADRLGYKRTLVGALGMMLMGYLMIAFLRDLPWIDNYTGFFMGVLVLATGTAFFKPAIQGTLAHILDRHNSSVGWGVFYWVVNVGAFIGHYLPTIFLVYSVIFPEPFYASPHSREAWRNLFLASAAFTALNLVLLCFFRDVPTGVAKSESYLRVLQRTVFNIFEPRLLMWIVIMSGFWLMMFQLWDLQPNFITDWVDSSAAVKQLQWLPTPIYNLIVAQTPGGPMLYQQAILSLNALFIILGVVAMSWVTRRMRTLDSMQIGMFMAIGGILVAGLTRNVWWVIFGILFFSLGEMLTGPKTSEYLGLIAPKDKKGMYLGYVNIPVGVGVYVGSKLAGYVYGHYGEKATLALKYIAEHFQSHGNIKWTGSVKELETITGFTRTEAMDALVRLTGLDPASATALLWQTYHPQLYIWIPFGVIGLLSAIGLIVFTRKARKWQDMNA